MARVGGEARKGRGKGEARRVALSPFLVKGEVGEIPDLKMI